MKERCPSFMQEDVGTIPRQNSAVMQPNPFTNSDTFYNQGEPSASNKSSNIVRDTKFINIFK